VHKALKELRRLCGMSQIELTRRSSVPRSRIQLAEAGVVELRSEELQAIRLALQPRLEKIGELIACDPELHSIIGPH
jgi:transcriptional regulator with XRE-family HTH domain